MTRLLEPLRRERAAIAERWLRRTLRTYPPEAARFFERSQNRFTNPVGRTLAEAIEALVDELLQAEDRAEQLCRHLDAIIRVRAVQEFTPARAVSFVFLVKDILREVLGESLARPELLEEWMQLETRIDQMILFAFDIYTKYRQRTYEIRVEEIKRRVAGLMKRSRLFVEDPPQEPTFTHRGGGQ